LNLIWLEIDQTVFWGVRIENDVMETSWHIEMPDFGRPGIGVRKLFPIPDGDGPLSGKTGRPHLKNPLSPLKPSD
jgi:hypothetical protein